MSDEVFEERLLDLAQDLLRRPGAENAPRDVPPLDRGLVLRYAQRLLATSLFGDLSEEELLAVVRGLRLHLHGPGDILVTEGERGQSVFVLAAGWAKVFVRSPSGRNFPVAELREGEFFGEISSLSGRPRTATVTAAARCELLELDRPTLDEIARVHPRVAGVLEEFYIRRASSPEAAAVRAVSMNDAGQERKAIEVLEAHFGQSRWDPRMRLRLADVLLKAGKFEDAVPVLIGLADDLARAGYPEKAIAVLKKIEKIRRRDIEVVNLAPLGRGAAPPARAPSPPRGRGAPAATGTAAKTAWSPQPTAEFFQGWLLDVLRDRVKRGEAAEGERPGGERPEGERLTLGSIRGYGPGLMASPLFEDFNDDELLAVIRGLRLLSFDAGDVIITEGEPGQSLFVLTTGTVKVFVRDPAGRNVALVPLGEGAFFGEIATLSGRPRSATVTAASRCELLELDKAALEAILKVHPRVLDVLEEHYIARANDPEAAAIRGTSRRADDPARERTS
jgi:CRP-like cAMP-binding protein